MVLAVTVVVADKPPLGRSSPGRSGYDVAVTVVVATKPLLSRSGGGRGRYHGRSHQATVEPQQSWS